MTTTLHVRGVLRDRVIEQIERRLKEEGYVLDATATPTFSAFDMSVREIRVVSGDDGGWVGVVDHPFAKTAWAERLSSALDTQVVKLSGECDHVYYSEAVLVDRGEVVGSSKVPEDAVLEADGRHRIRPAFLAAVAPDAKAALEAGIVVHDLGGEENILAVGNVLGIRHPLVDADDAVRLVFRQIREEGAADLLPAERPLDVASLIDNLARSFGATLAAQGLELPEALRELREQAVPALFVSVNPWCGTEGDPNGGFVVTVSLGSTCGRARGLELDISGPGLELLEPLTAMSTYHVGETAPEMRSEAEIAGDVRRFRFPELELALSEKRRAKAQKTKSLLGGMFRGAVNVGGLHGDDGAQVCFRFASPLLRKGSGEIRVVARFAELEPTDPDAQLEIEASDTRALEVRAAPRRPILPASVDPATLDPQRLERYAATDMLCGWVGFAAPWSDVAHRVAPMMHDLVKMLREVSGLALATARVQTHEHETLTFEGPQVLESSDAPWAKMTAALVLGAQLSLDDDSSWGSTMCVDDAERRFASLGLVHYKDGGPPGWPAKDVYGTPLDHVRVVLSWSLTSPRDAKAALRAADVSRSIVLAAGHVAANVGGFVTLERNAVMVGQPTAYEQLLGFSHGPTQTWCESHARTPAWCVLVPPRAASRLAGRSPSGRILVTPVPHGLLITGSSDTPFGYAPVVADVEAMERFLLPVFDVSPPRTP